MGSKKDFVLSLALFLATKVTSHDVKASTWHLIQDKHQQNAMNAPWKLQQLCDTFTKFQSFTISQPTKQASFDV